MAIALQDINNAIVVKNPWSKGGVYIKKRSFTKGATPAHLESYTANFTTAARDCKAVMSGLEGKEKVEAYRACIGNKLRR